jgi:glycosyltransferase 2 family protein
MKKSSKHPIRSLLVNALLVALAFGLLGYTISKNRDQIRAVLGHSLDPRLLALGFALYLTSLLMTFVRWFWLVRAIEPAFPLRATFLLGFIGNVFNLVIPGAVGGDLIKAAYLVRMKINRTQAVASMVIDRILGLLGLFLLAGIAGVVAWPMAEAEVRRLIVVAWSMLAVGSLGLAAIFGQALTRRFPGLLHGHGRRAVILRELRAMSETYRRRLGVVFAGLALSVVGHVLNVLAFYTASRTLFPTGLPSLAQHFLMVPLILFTMVVPLPGGALGLTEQVSQQLFRLVAHPGGALAMMGFRVLMYGVGIISACVYFGRMGEVRSLTDVAEHLEEELEGDELDDPPPGSDLEGDPLPVHPDADGPEHGQDMGRLEERRTS